MEAKVHIRQLDLSIQIGHLAPERIHPQRIVLDLEVGLLNSRATTTRELTDTVCYSTATKGIARLASSQEWVLLEEFAGAICDYLFQEFSSAADVRLLVQKFVVPSTAWTGFELIQTRSEWLSGNA